jgi:fumarate hydratase class II
MMPGKVNPTQCEAMTMVAVQVLGHHTAIAMAGAQGQLELNTFRPLMIHDFLDSVRLLADASRSFVDHLLEGLEVDRARIEAHVRNSLMLVTALTPRLGYDRAARIARAAAAEGLSLREAALRSGYLTGEEFDALVRPERMV